MLNWLRHAFGGGSPASDPPPLPDRAPVKPATTQPAPKPATAEKRVDTPTTENIQDRFLLKKVI